jgi:hypothetical protein
MFISTYYIFFVFCFQRHRHLSDFRTAYTIQKAHRKRKKAKKLKLKSSIIL